MTTAIYSHPDCKRHEMGVWHPECPARLQAIEDQLIASRIDSLLESREAPKAELSAIARVHSMEAIARVQDNVPAFDDACNEYYPLDADTMLNAHSWNAALRAAGAAIAATDAVIAGEIDNAFCAVRPPGHHACRDKAMGFCFFNNVAIAARHAIEEHGLERVAIVDFDVHHGNGTEDILSNDPRVLMVGIFQHPFYPYSGTEHPAPNMLNLPVPAYTKGMDVRELIETCWMPRLEAFKPQMIFVSAGFDAHRDDDLGQLRLNEQDFGWITSRVVDLARRHSNGRIVSMLEG